MVIVMNSRAPVMKWLFCVALSPVLTAAPVLAQNSSFGRSEQTLLTADKTPSPSRITDLVGKRRIHFSADGRASIVPTAQAITAHLGEEVNALIALSPSLQADLFTLAQTHWKITYGSRNQGSFTNREKAVIMLDGHLRQHATQAIAVLAHEIGHAMHPYTPDYSSQEHYLENALADEGIAVINNIRVQREILAAKGTDIGIVGIDNEQERTFYNAVYDILSAGNISREQAQHKIGQTYRHKIASTTHQTYEETSQAWYNNAYLPWFECVHSNATTDTPLNPAPCPG